MLWSHVTYNPRVFTGSVIQPSLKDWPMIMCCRVRCRMVCGLNWSTHYNDAIRGLIASQITSLTIVYSAFHSGTDQRKRQSSACGEFAGDRWIPRTNGQLRGKCFHLMKSSCSVVLLSVYLCICQVTIVLIVHYHLTSMHQQLLWVSFSPFTPDGTDLFQIQCCASVGHCRIPSGKGWGHYTANWILFSLLHNVI